MGLIEGNTDCRNWSLRLSHHLLEHRLEIPKQAIDSRGIEKMRLVDTSSYEAVYAFVQH